MLFSAFFLFWFISSFLTFVFFFLGHFFAGSKIWKMLSLYWWNMMLTRCLHDNALFMHLRIIRRNIFEWQKGIHFYINVLMNFFSLSHIAYFLFIHCKCETPAKIFIFTFTISVIYISFSKQLLKEVSFCSKRVAKSSFKTELKKAKKLSNVQPKATEVQLFSYVSLWCKNWQKMQNIIWLFSCIFLLLAMKIFCQIKK